VVLEYPSVILTENEPRHCTEIPVWLPRSVGR
jgi:hypothetical protein